MKEETLKHLDDFRKALKNLKAEISEIPTERVSRKHSMSAADEIATFWVENLRSPLEYKFRLNSDVISKTSEAMKHLHILSRPNNLKTSYLETINEVLNKFDDKFILPIKQTGTEFKSFLDLRKILATSQSSDETLYLKEAINCAESGFWRAAIVMGWCATIDKIQKKIIQMGFEKFNQTSVQMKSQPKGKYRRWNKEFSVTTLAELQEVFDSDLILVLEGMGILEGNQTERLFSCFQYRNHSAHPGQAPIEEPHVIIFFNDINSIILNNPLFDIVKESSSQETG